MHFDVQALVTVVIPLNDGYEGGLFVGTERENATLILMLAMPCCINPIFSME